MLTTLSIGFMSAPDKAKLDDIATGAQVEILSPSDALELTSRKDTFLHLHPEVTTTANGFIGTADKTKLDSVEAGAQENALSDGEATNLTDGSNADALHLHFFPVPVETFTAMVHDTIDHTGIPGASGFTQFNVSESFFIGPFINTGGSQIFTKTYSFAPETLSGGWSFLNSQHWNTKDTFFTDGFSISGNDGIIEYRVEDSNPGGSSIMTMSCWQGAYGI